MPSRLYCASIRLLVGISVNSITQKWINLDLSIEGIALGQVKFSYIFQLLWILIVKPGIWYCPIVLYNRMLVFVENNCEMLHTHVD